MEDCARFVEEWQDSRLELGIILKNRLALIFHEIDDEATVYTVFEVLNSRGLECRVAQSLEEPTYGDGFHRKRRGQIREQSMSCIRFGRRFIGV